jgi:hypothetical protein
VLCLDCKGVGTGRGSAGKGKGRPATTVRRSHCRCPFGQLSLTLSSPPCRRPDRLSPGPPPSVSKLAGAPGRPVSRVGRRGEVLHAARPGHMLRSQDRRPGPRQLLQARHRDRSTWRAARGGAAGGAVLATHRQGGHQVGAAAVGRAGGAASQALLLPCGVTVSPPSPVRAGQLTGRSICSYVTAPRRPRPRSCGALAGALLGAPGSAGH